MSEPKLSTADILAKIRAAKPAASSDAPAAPPAAEAPATAATPPAEAAPPPAAKPAPAAKPGSTSDILAAIRAQGAKGAAAPAAEAPKAAAPKPAAAKPSGTSDILAAIRAGKTGAAAPAGDAPAASAAPAAKPAAAVASGAPKPSVEEMLKAVRGEKAAADVATSAPVIPVKPTLPPIPVKPGAAKDKKGATDRRSFVAICFSPLVIAFGSMAATSLLWLLDLARFMFPNVLVEPPTKFKIGPPSDYPLGGVSTKWLAARGVWIVHTDQYKGQNLIYALASVCTHLGCTPNWLEGEQKYKCPCHGSGFYINGINFEGPAPRPLERVGIKLASDGQLEVDKSVKFQEEMGQWADSNSFVDGTLV